MSPIMTIGRSGFLLLIGLVVLAGCGTANNNAPLDSDSGKHGVAGWLPAGHMTAAQANLSDCKSCHGEDLLGGISQVSCVTCHLGGPTSIHPSDWAGNAILTNHGPYVKANDTTSCRNVYCHGYSLQGVASSGPTCNNPNGTCHSYP